MRSLVLLAVLSVAFAADPSITVSAVPASVAVGKDLAVTITYQWDATWSPVTTPNPMPALSALFITAAPAPEQREDATGGTRIVRVIIAAERSGAWELPAISAIFRDRTGTERVVTAPTVTVQVGTEAAPPALPDPLPALTRPTAGSVHDQRWWWIGGGVLAVIALVTVVLWRRRVDIATARDPHACCQDALNAAVAQSEGKEAAAALGLALRTWAGEVYGFDGAGATVREVAAMLRARPVCPVDEARAVVRLLEQLDDGRWHPGILPMSAMVPQVAEARMLVNGVAARLAQVAAAAAKATS